MSESDDARPFKLTQEFLRNPYPILTSLQSEAPAFQMEGNGFRMWVITRHDDVRRILKSPAIKKDVVGTRKERVMHSMVRAERKARIPARSRRSLLDRDGNDHHRLRGLIQHAFQRDRIAALRPRICELADELISALPSSGLIDVHNQFALPMATGIVSELAGVPPEFRQHFPPLVSNMLTGSSVEAVEEAGENLYQFALALIDEIRKRPSDNLFSRLISLYDDGRMDEDELASMFVVLLVGGLEPATAISNGIMLLLSHPEQRDRLIIDPQMMDNCVEEILRYESPFRMLPPRYCEEPIDLDGVTIPAKEMIIFCIASANRDPSLIENGDHFDISRVKIPHLSFGHGPHRCIGAELGRVETGESIAAFLRRFPRAEMAVALDSVTWRPTTFLRRLDSLPVNTAP